MRAVVEADVTQGPRKVVKAAEAAGYYLVGTVSRGSLVFRGWAADGRRFVSCYLDGQHEVSYRWSREQSSRLEGGRPMPTWHKSGKDLIMLTTVEAAPDLDEEVTWITEKPEPIRVSVTELVTLLKGEVQ